jgi:hypothetical protein
MANYGTKTFNLYEKRDPIRNLWRNVLIVGIEDLLKKKEFQYKWNRKAYCLEEMKVFKAIEQIKEKHEKRETSMPEMPRQWIYKNNEVSGRSERRDSSMSDV